MLSAIMEGAFWLFLHETGKNPSKAEYITVGKLKPVA